MVHKGVQRICNLAWWQH